VGCSVSCLRAVRDLSQPRWGRTNEEFGEDVHLAASMVGQQVRGMTNDGNLTSDTSVAALLKHLWVYSIGEGGLNTMPAHAGKREVCRGVSIVEAVDLD
jgi:beta-glucosidase